MRDRFTSWLRLGLEDLAKVIDRKSLLRVFLGLALFVSAILVTPTLSEFCVALYNRYQVYPLASDTNMLARSMGLAGYISLGTAILIAKVWKLSVGRNFITTALLVLGFCSMLFTWMPGFIVVGFILLNILNALYARPFWFIVLIAGCLVILSGLGVSPSRVPADWCVYELTMYPCQVINP